MKLKIAFFVGSFPSISETFIVNQITDLIDRGHTISIFAFHHNNCELIHQKILDYNLLEKTVYKQDTYLGKITRYFDFFRYIIFNIKHIDLDKLMEVFNFRKYRKKALNLRNYTRYKWILTNGHFDVFHAHFGPAGCYIAEMKSFGFYASSKLVTSFHGYDISPHLMAKYPKIYELLFQEVDLITANTKYTESLLQKLTSLGKIEILPVGLDTAKFKKKKINGNEDFTILFVGRLIEFKGPHLAIEIFNLLVQRGFQNIKLIIIGEGVMKDQLEENIENYNLQEKVKLTGAMSQERIIDLMETVDVFVLPGIYDKNGRGENQGLVLQEAQAMELPVVISDVGGMKYGIIDGVTGFVVKEKDIEGFVNKIEFLINNENERKEMGERGRAYIIKNFDSKVLGEKLVKDYIKLTRK